MLKAKYSEKLKVRRPYLHVLGADHHGSGPRGGHYGSWRPGVTWGTWGAVTRTRTAGEGGTLRGSIATALLANTRGLKSSKDTDTIQTIYISFLHHLL